MKRAFLALTTSLALTACGSYPSGPQGSASARVGKGDGESFGGIMTLVNGETQQLHLECPFGEFCGVNINNWWLSGIEMQPQEDTDRYGIGVETRAEAPEGTELSSRIAGVGDLGTFSVFRGAATLTIEPQGWLPPNGVEVELEFPSCGWVTWCPSFKRAFRR